MSSITLANVPVGKAFDFSGDTFTLVKHNSKNAIITDGRNEFNLNRQAIVQNMRDAAPIVELSVEEQIEGNRRMIEAWTQANPDALFEGYTGRIVCIRVGCAGMTLQSDIVFSNRTKTFHGLGGEPFTRMSPAAVKRWRIAVSEFESKGLCECGKVQ